MFPRILVLDDLFGRDIANGRNVDRENLCAQFLWRDITGDAAALASAQEVLRPTAEAVFHRAQSPLCAVIGDVVENDLTGAIAVIREHWFKPGIREEGLGHETAGCLSMLLLDLCFLTGPVTAESHAAAPGMPQGHADDASEDSYFGLKLLKEINREFPDLPVFILSSMQRRPIASEFSHSGAFGFIDRSDPNGPATLYKALARHGLMPDAAGAIVGRSLPLLLALRDARVAAENGQDVLIRGERGTGKELLAQYIRRMSPDSAGRQPRPFVAVNSPVLSSGLYASELYGIESGSATGVSGRKGLLETSDGGDVFLDEVADMAPDVQASLLRVLQERQIMPVGGRQTKKIDIRVIAATNAQIDDPKLGLRPDLLDRLAAGGTIWLPPLRERIEDVPLLAGQFARETEKRNATALEREISNSALDKLMAYDWPGNIRELRSVVADAVNRYPDVEYLVPEHLRIGRSSRGGATSSLPPPHTGMVTSEPHADSLHVRANTSDAHLPHSREFATAREDKDVIDSLLQYSGSVRFSRDNVQDWAGKLHLVQKGQQLLIARMVLAALEATKRRTPERPDGVLQIHPAMKLLAGDARLTASKAADMLKRLLGPLEEELEGDLKEALEIAMRLRPRHGRGN